MDATQHRATLRVMDVLDFVSKNKDGYGLTEIAAALQIPKGTLSPIIRTLLEEQYIRKEESSGKYMMGIKCFEIGNRFVEQFNVLDEIKHLIKTVVTSCNETCHFAIRDGKDVIYLFKEESPEPIRMVSSIGMRLPAHSTAIGKALLSGCEEKQVRELYHTGLPKITPNTIDDIDQLCDQIEKVRTEKLAYETEESSMNVTCIAAPIEKGGEVVAAVSVSVPIFRANEEKMEQIKAILLHTKKIIEDLIENIPFRF